MSFYTINIKYPIIQLKTINIFIIRWQNFNLSNLIPHIKFIPIFKRIIFTKPHCFIDLDRTIIINRLFKLKSQRAIKVNIICFSFMRSHLSCNRWIYKIPIKNIFNSFTKLGRNGGPFISRAASCFTIISIPI